MVVLLLLFQSITCVAEILVHMTELYSSDLNTPTVSGTRSLINADYMDGRQRGSLLYTHNCGCKGKGNNTKEMLGFSRCSSVIS